MSILIQRPGILTTVQDLGRYGFRRFGINPGGVMDPAAARLINVLLGNSEREAVLEMHFPAPQIIFEKEAVAAIGGADFLPHLDGKPVRTWQVFRAKPGSILYFAGKGLGNRAYLAIKSGLEIDRWLGSSSTNLIAARGGLSGRRLEAKDRIGFRSSAMENFVSTGTRLSPWIIPPYSSTPTVKVNPGAEFTNLSDHAREIFLSRQFEISGKSDRMGFRLTGEAVELSECSEMISSAVSFGTIQALPDNQLIILMADHQTTGGYPRLAHVISHDLPLIGQLGPGDKVAFQLVTPNRAEKLYLEFERNLKFLGAGSKFESAPD
ncbi:biotin-dependent carboxyltransferase family protein [soil metagenome]